MTYGRKSSAPFFAAPQFAAEQRPDGHAPWLFLSLYLLLFAFFIVLNSFSSFNEGRREAVISSVLDAFTTVISAGDSSNSSGLISIGNQSREFQAAVANIFGPSIPLANLQIVESGTRMDIDVPIQVWFEGDGLIVRDPLPMLDRIVATVSSPPEGFFYEIVLIAQIPAEAKEALSRDMKKEIQRIGNIARELGNKGMPPNAISIGIESGDPRFIRVVFLAVESQDSIRASLSIGGQGQ